MSMRTDNVLKHLAVKSHVQTRRKERFVSDVSSQQRFRRGVVVLLVFTSRHKNHVSVDKSRFRPVSAL